MEPHVVAAATAWLAIDWTLAAIVSWIAIGMVGVLRPHNFFVVARVLFPLGALVSLLVAVAAVSRSLERRKPRCCRSACRGCRFT